MLISHHSSVHMANRILSLEHEQLKERNSHEKLLGQNDKYNGLCQLQAKGQL